MTWIAGVDGCPAGWFRACRETRTGELAFDVLESAAALVVGTPRPAVIALDIPVGLPDAGPRACDREARALLGPRRSSVFPAPVRPALAATTREEASAITRRADGRGVGAQAWNIYSKVREVDDLLAASAAARSAIREVHPELSFRAWNGSRPMAESKKTPGGRARRLALAEEWLGRGVIEAARGGRPRRTLADDDVLDAIAALWTAHRIETGRAEALPRAAVGDPPRDATGLPMEIVF